MAQTAHDPVYAFAGPGEKVDAVKSGFGTANDGDTLDRRVGEQGGAG